MNRYALTALALASLLSLCRCSADEERLLQSLLQAYDRQGVGTLVLPRAEPQHAARVQFGAALISMDVDASANLMLTSLWLRQSWNDPSLTWDPSQHGGIELVRLPIQKIWRPDITLYNSYDLAMEVDETSLAVVTSDGTVLWIPPARTKTRCRPDPESGEWYCSLKFGSWTYDGFNLLLEFYNNLEQLDVSDYIPSDEKLLSNEARQNVKYYPCCEEPYPDLTYTLHFTK